MFYFWSFLFWNFLFLLGCFHWLQLVLLLFSSLQRKNVSFFLSLPPPLSSSPPHFFLFLLCPPLKNAETFLFKLPFFTSHKTFPIKKKKIICFFYHVFSSHSSYPPSRKNPTFFFSLILDSKKDKNLTFSYVTHFGSQESKRNHVIWGCVEWTRVVWWEVKKREKIMRHVLNCTKRNKKKKKMSTITLIFIRFSCFCFSFIPTLLFTKILLNHFFNLINKKIK